jgi:anion-transporting  ArsA/GET3 family ATPase
MAARLEGKRVVICAGSGGVGKTTTSAALAIGLAAEGRRVAVVTIDPARRLAGSLGLEELGNEPALVAPERLAGHGLEVRGELWAMMLDAKRTFDELIEWHAPDERTRDAVLSNRIYQELSNAVAGSQEYMAMEKLYELSQEGRYDLLVLDTPPTRNALDFLDAPRRMTDFFESRVLRWFLLPYMKAGGGLMRFANVAASTFLKLVTRIVGAEVLKDTAEFFGNLEGMYDGFKQRARDVSSLLHSSETAFVVVTSPAAESVGEATYFASQLNKAGLPFGALVVNRVHPRFGDGIRASRRNIGRLERGDARDRLLAGLLRNESAFMRLVDLEERNLTSLARKIPRHLWVRVPYLEQEAVDFPGLAAIADRLVAVR